MTSDVRPGNAIILGGTSGLGRETGNLLAGAGWNVTLIGRTLRESARSRQTHMHCELTGNVSVSTVCSNIKLFNEQPHLFVWAAAEWDHGNFEDISVQRQMQLMNVNFTAALPIVQTVWELQRRLAEKVPAFFMAICSTTAKALRPDEAVYGASLAARAKLTQMLAYEARSLPNLHVSIFYPGGIKTGLYRHDPHPAYEQFTDPELVAAEILCVGLEPEFYPGGSQPIKGNEYALELDLPRDYFHRNSSSLDAAEACC